MLRKHEAKFQSGAKVVCLDGWDRMFNRPEFFTDFPSFTVEAAQWIAARRIGLLGMDMPTPSTEWKEVHWALLGKGTEIVIVEGLANLDRVPERFTLAAFPLNITGRDGSPVRAVALLTTERPKDHFGVEEMGWHASRGAAANRQGRRPGGFHAQSDAWRRESRPTLIMWKRFSVVLNRCFSGTLSGLFLLEGSDCMRGAPRQSGDCHRRRQRDRPGHHGSALPGGSLGHLRRRQR